MDPGDRLTELVYHMENKRGSVQRHMTQLDADPMANQNGIDVYASQPTVDLKDKQ